MLTTAFQDHLPEEGADTPNPVTILGAIPAPLSDINKPLFWQRRTRARFTWVASGITFGLMLSLGIMAENNWLEQTRNVKPILVIEDANVPTLSHDGSRISVGPEIGRTEVYDVNTGRKLGSFREKLSEASILSVDGQRVSIFGYGINTVYNVDTGRKTRQRNVSIIHDGKHVGGMTVLNLAGLATRNYTSDLNFVADTVDAKTDNPDPNLPAVLLGRLDDNSLVREYRTEDRFIHGDYWDQVALTPNGKYIAANRRNRLVDNRDRTVVWNAETGHIAFSIPFQTSWFSLSDDGARIVTGSTLDDGKIACWSLLTGKLIWTFSHMSTKSKVLVNAGYLSPDGMILATAGMGDIMLWDAETGKILASQPQDDISDSCVKAVTFSGDGKRIAVATDSEIVTVWSLTEILKNGRPTIEKESAR